MASGCPGSVRGAGSRSESSCTPCAAAHSAGAADAFTAALLDIAKTVQAEGSHQALSLGLHRSDYMLHEDGSGAPTPLQIELNTVAASFAGLSGALSALHKRLLTRYGLAVPAVAAHLLGDGPGGSLQQLPNAPANGMAAGLAAAHAAYGGRK